MNLSELILSVFPADRILRIDEVHDLIRTATDKPYKRESVRAVLFRLFKDGDLRRIQTGRTTGMVRYRRPECQAATDPITLREWAATIQAKAGRELRPAEIMVRMSASASLAKTRSPRRSSRGSTCRSGCTCGVSRD